MSKYFPKERSKIDSEINSNAKDIKEGHKKLDLVVNDGARISDLNKWLKDHYITSEGAVEVVVAMKKAGEAARDEFGRINRPLEQKNKKLQGLYDDLYTRSVDARSNLNMIKESAENIDTVSARKALDDAQKAALEDMIFTEVERKKISDIQTESEYRRQQAWEKFFYFMPATGSYRKQLFEINRSNRERQRMVELEEKERLGAQRHQEQQALASDQKDTPSQKQQRYIDLTPPAYEMNQVDKYKGRTNDE